MPLNIPILLTWLRIILIPLLIGVYYVPEAWVQGIGRNLAATLIFVVAAVTDWLDGYLARRWHQTSAFGAFLDPVADKLMVAAALIVLVQLGRLDAVLAMIKGGAKALIEHNITVNGYGPGVVRTELWEQLDKDRRDLPIGHRRKRNEDRYGKDDEERLAQCRV